MKIIAKILRNRRFLIPFIKRKFSRKKYKKVIAVHVGTHKTGSTFLQYNLSSQPFGLNANGMLFDNGSVDLGYFLSENSPLSQRKLVEIKEKYFNFIDNARQQFIILSSEGFCGSYLKGYRNLFDVVQDLKTILNGNNVRIYCFVRRQDKFITLTYHQFIKEGGTLNFSDFCSMIDIHSFHWDQLLDIYASAFGHKNVRALVFEEIFKEAGAIINKTFFSEGKWDTKGFKDLNVERNPGLNSKGLEILRLCNPILNTYEQKKLSSLVTATFPKTKKTVDNLFSDEQQADLMQYYKKSNIRLFSNYLEGRSQIECWYN